MRWRTGAALVLCGPLVAGCGAATRIDFAPHSRPASPLEISVLASRNFGLALHPSVFRAGLVLFNVTNQTAHAERYTVRERGRLLARTPMVAPGQAAQLKAMLRGFGDTLNSFSQTSARGTLSDTVDLTVSAPARSGDNDVAQS